ncbi:MAG: PPOX class F420-dependent oxidoreductase [Acidimicrobiia bacterium]|nr:PPOX class F420-dependent oxidoreductase [Acidimicrobiia bacterium]
MTTVTEALDFAREHHRGVIVTRLDDGRVQTSPIVATVDDGDRLVVSSRETAYKVKQLRRDPRATICLFTDDFFGPWVQLEGEAEILSLPDAMEPLVEYYRSLRGEHPDWDEYREAMREEQRVLIRIDPERAGPDRTG